MTVKFGIVGCGAIGPRHAEKLQGLDAKLVAVCDVITERVNELAEKHGCRAYYDFATMLAKEQTLADRMDVVNICTPSGMHAGMSIQALKDYHVVCEKPMAVRVSGAQQMITASEQSKKKLFIVKQNRYNPPIILGKKAIDEHIGKLFYVGVNVLWNRPQQYYDNATWRGTKRMDGGPLMTQASHFIDLMGWYGGDVKKVYAITQTFNHKIEVEDTGIVSVLFTNGALGNITYTTCMYHKNFEGSILVVGEHGAFKVGGEYLNRMDLWEIDGCPLPLVGAMPPANDYGTYKGSASNHDKVFQNVIDVLTKDGKICVSGNEGIKTIQVVEAIQKSAARHKEVYV